MERSDFYRRNEDESSSMWKRRKWEKYSYNFAGKRISGERQKGSCH